VNWFTFLKESLNISDIFDNAIPNFYNKVIGIHPEMKNILDAEAGQFRALYFNYLKDSPNTENPTEEELFTEILLLCMQMQSYVEEGREGVPDKSMTFRDEIDQSVPEKAILIIINNLVRKFNLPRNVVVQFSEFIKVVLYGFTEVSQKGLQSNISKSWKNILNKNQVQTQRQGFRLDDKDEDYVLEDEDDCLQKLLAFIESKYKSKKTGSEPDYLTYHDNYFGPTNGKKARELIVTSFLPEVPDDLYCVVLKLLEANISQTPMINWDRKQAGPPTGYSPAPDLYLNYDEDWSEPFGEGKLESISYEFSFKGWNMLGYYVGRPSGR